MYAADDDAVDVADEYVAVYVVCDVDVDVFLYGGVGVVMYGCVVPVVVDVADDDGAVAVGDVCVMLLLRMMSLLCMMVLLLFSVVLLMCNSL